MTVGIASIQQETNTFSIAPTGADDFTVAIGPDLLHLVEGTNSELWGAIETLTRGGAEAYPLVYAWAMPSGRLTGPAFEWLSRLLVESLEKAPHLDALVLCLHGSMAAEQFDDADGRLLDLARSIVGPSVPIAVSLDLHANVTKKMVTLADSISAYHTDPHIDMANAGARAAARALSMIDGGRPAMGFAKLPLIIPAETMNTTTGPLATIRQEALAAVPEGLVELGLFPVQPWLDVPELGFSVVAVSDGDPEDASGFAEAVADRIWRRRQEFRVERLFPPEVAIEEAIKSQVRPFVIAESADAPTAGASGDSPAMIAAFQASTEGLVVYIPVVDPGSVAACFDAEEGARVELEVGASIDTRWWSPVRVVGVVTRLGQGRYRLEGASFTGMEVSMGRFATIESGNIRLLLTERAAWTSDPATFRFADLDPSLADVIVVRSCSDFRANYLESASEAVTLDVPGAATPRLESLNFESLERQPYPLDPWPELSVDVKGDRSG